ncbi:MAG: hypothetical protein ABIM50_07835 [Novosphingobium sp.]
MSRMSGQETGRKQESRALSAGNCVRQAWAIALALLIAGPASAAPGGDLETIPIGDYVCELPGDATGPAGRHVPGEDFTVVTASSYRSGGAMGSYLLAGDQLTMTSGPLQGKRYQRQSEGFVRMLDAEGNPGDLRCVRRKGNNR